MNQEIGGAIRYEMIYDRIKDDIINDRLKPMTKLNVKELSKQFGVSRSPVVTAIRSLERDGYVVILPQNGTFVRNLSKQEIEALYDIRILIEQKITELIVDQADAQSLRSFRGSFEKLLKSKKGHAKLADEYFKMELDFHNYLGSCCPAIIHTITRNIVDLTRRTRKLSLTSRPDNEVDESWLKNDIENHIRIIDAILSKDIETARKYTVNDIEGTKNRVMNIT